MQTLPDTLLELFQSEDPDLIHQAIELLRAQLDDDVVLGLILSEPSIRHLPLPFRGARLSGCTIQHPLIGYDLQGADLSHADLRGIRLTDTDLRGADLSHADLRGTNLLRARLSDARLTSALVNKATKASLTADFTTLIWLCPHADLPGTSLAGVDLSGTDFSGANLSGADLSGADLSDSILSGAQMSGARLQGADLRRAVLYYTDLSDARLEDVLWEGADLRAVDFSGASGHQPPVRTRIRPPQPPPQPPRPKMRDMRGERRPFQVLSAMSLSHIDWSGVDLRGADLRGAVLRHVRLRDADLRGAHLGGVVLEDVDLTGARLDGADLRGVVSGCDLPASEGRPIAPGRPLLERALSTDRPADWRALGDAQGGAEGMLHRAWGDWLAAAGRRLDLEWGAERPVLHALDPLARLSAHRARLQASAAWREGSHRWTEVAVSTALSTCFLPDVGVLRWVSACQLQSEAGAMARWSPEDPVLLLRPPCNVPPFPAAADPEAEHGATVARGWLWGGHLCELWVSAHTSEPERAALFSSDVLDLTETIRVSDVATLRGLAEGPPRPALRAVYLISMADRIRVPDVSAAAPNLERLVITQVAGHESMPATVSVPRLSLPWLRRLQIMRRRRRRSDPAASKLRQITLGEVSLPGLIQSTIEAESIRGLMKALPLG